MALSHIRHKVLRLTFTANAKPRYAVLRSTTDIQSLELESNQIAVPCLLCLNEPNAISDIAIFADTREFTVPFLEHQASNNRIEILYVTQSDFDSVIKPRMK